MALPTVIEFLLALYCLLALAGLRRARLLKIFGLSPVREQIRDVARWGWDIGRARTGMSNLMLYPVRVLAAGLGVASYVGLVLAILVVMTPMSIWYLFRRSPNRGAPA